MNKNMDILNNMNKSIALKCSTVDEIYENIPFLDDELFEEYFQLRCAFPGSVAPIGGILTTGKNIFKKINSNSKNIFNLNIENGDVEKFILNKDIHELVRSIKFNNFSIHRYLNNLKVYKGLEKREIMDKSNFRDKYIEGVFANDNAKNKRNPSRDCIIGLSIAFELNLVETNYLLKAAGYNELYIRNRRDLIVIKGILDGFDIKQLNKTLEYYNESKIGNKDEYEG